MSDPELIIERKSVDDGKRTCSECLHPLPLTEEFYHRDPHAHDGFCPICKVCRRKYRQEKRDPKLQQQISRVKFQAIKAAIDGKADAVIPTNEELGLMVAREAGGVDQIIRDLQNDYETAKEGSLMRVKCMEMRLKVLQKAAEARPVIPLDQLSDEELESALLGALERQAQALEDHSDEPE